MHPKFVSATVLSLLLVTPAPAAECLLANATYVQDNSSFVLQFKPRPADTSITTSNVFTLNAPVDGKRMDLAGEVIWGNGVAVPGGFIWQDCPTEPAEDEPQWCTYWEGIVYGLGGDKAFDLPDEASPAPKGILLSDLGRSLHYSGLVLDELPNDYFRLEGCK
jgi:hypothetical protein